MPTLQTDTRTATKLPDIFKTINGVNVDIGPLDRLRDGQSPLGPYTSSVAHGRKNQRDSSPERHEAGATSGGGYGTCPRIVLRDGFGRELDTFTTLQAAIYRAKWNVQQTGLARVPLEWRLPKGPLPARPDLSRTCPPPKHPPAHHGGDNTRQQWDGSRVLEFDVEDVCFVQESLQYLPYAPSLSFLRQEILVGPKTYFQIVGTVLLHRKVLSVTEKRKAVHNFPGFCTGCIRMGLCYGCEKSSDIHFHEDKPVKTGGGFTYFKKDRPKHEIQGRHPSNWKIKHPERALKKLMEGKWAGLHVYIDTLEGVIPEEVKRELDRQDRSSSQPKLPVSNIPDFAGHAQLHNTAQGRDGLLPDIFRKQGITDDLDTEGQHYHGHEGDLDIEGQHYHGHEGDLDLGDVKVVLSEDNSSDSESGAETESDTGGHLEDEGLARGNEQPVGGEAVPRSGLANVNLSIADSGSSRFNRDRRRSSSRSSSKYEHRLPKQRRTSPARDDDAADDGPSRTRHRGEGSDDGEEGGQSYFDDLARGRSRRRGSLYKAPPPFKLKKSPKRRIEAKSPFSSNREYDIPKGDGFQVKKSDKKLTEIKEFSSGEVSWKEPKKFTLKKGESKTTKFWSGPPKQADVIKRRKKRERKPRSKSPRYRKSSSPRPVSPDSGLDSENLTEASGDEGIQGQHCGKQQKRAVGLTLSDLESGGSQGHMEEQGQVARHGHVGKLGPGTDCWPGREMKVAQRYSLIPYVGSSDRGSSDAGSNHVTSTEEDGESVSSGKDQLQKHKDGKESQGKPSLDKDRSHRLNHSLSSHELTALLSLDPDLKSSHHQGDNNSKPARRVNTKNRLLRSPLNETLLSKEEGRESLLSAVKDKHGDLRATESDQASYDINIPSSNDLDNRFYKTRNLVKLTDSGMRKTKGREKETLREIGRSRREEGEQVSQLRQQQCVMLDERRPGTVGGKLPAFISPRQHTVVPKPPSKAAIRQYQREYKKFNEAWQAERMPDDSIVESRGKTDQLTEQRVLTDEYRILDDTNGYCEKPSSVCENSLIKKDMEEQLLKVASPVDIVDDFDLTREGSESPKNEEDHYAGAIIQEVKYSNRTDAITENTLKEIEANRDTRKEERNSTDSQVQIEDPILMKQLTAPVMFEDLDFDRGSLTSLEPDLEFDFSAVIDVEALEGIDELPVVDIEQVEEQKLVEREKRRQRKAQRRKDKEMRLWTCGDCDVSMGCLGNHGDKVGSGRDNNDDDKQTTVNHQLTGEIKHKYQKGEQEKTAGDTEDAASTAGLQGQLQHKRASGNLSDDYKQEMQNNDHAVSCEPSDFPGEVDCQDHEEVHFNIREVVDMERNRKTKLKQKIISEVTQKLMGIKKKAGSVPGQSGVDGEGEECVSDRNTDTVTRQLQTNMRHRNRNTNNLNIKMRRQIKVLPKSNARKTKQPRRHSLGSVDEECFSQLPSIQTQLAKILGIKQIGEDHGRCAADLSLISQDLDIPGGNDSEETARGNAYMISNNVFSSMGRERKVKSAHDALNIHHQSSVLSGLLDYNQSGLVDLKSRSFQFQRLRSRSLPLACDLAQMRESLDVDCARREAARRREISPVPVYLPAFTGRKPIKKKQFPHIRKRVPGRSKSADIMIVPDSTTKSELEPLREETTITVTPEPDMERGPTPLQLRTVTPDRSTESPATGRKREIVKKERKLRTPQPVQEPEPVIEEPRVTPVREKTLTPEPSRTTTPASREISFVFVKEPSLPELPPIEVPALPELLPVPKSEVKEVKKERKLIEVTPELPEPKKKLPPPPKLAPKIKVRSTGRKSKVAEAPVTTEELQQLSDPLDFLAKYCIINPDRLPFYERVFNGAMNSQTPRYSHDHHKALKLGMVQFPPAQLSDHELHMLRDLTVITHAQSPRREGMNVPEQYLEKLNYSLEFIKSKQDALQDHMHSLQCEKIHLMAEMAKSLDRDIARVDYKTKGKKKKKKKKKKSSDPDYDMLGSMSAAKHFQPTRASDITDEVIVSRMDEKMMKKVKKDPIVKQLTLKISRDIEKLKSYDQRVIQIEDEKDLVGLYCMDYFFNEETASAPPYAFRRQQSRLYQKLHPDPDVQMNLDEVPAALQQVNNKLLTDKEFQYIYFILDLPKREKINFRLFSIIAALSEKVTQMDPVIRKLLNKVDYNALDVKMEKSKELFELLQDESRLPSGRAPADILEVELAAGGLTPEHTHYVLSKFNREGKGFIDFLDFVTYVPLFIEIHKRIVGDPFNDTQDI